VIAAQRVGACTAAGRPGGRRRLEQERHAIERPHRRRAAVSDLLPQAAPPTPAPASRRRQPVRATTIAKRLAHHRHSHHWTHRQARLLPKAA